MCIVYPPVLLKGDSDELHPTIALFPLMDRGHLRNGGTGGSVRSKPY